MATTNTLQLGTRILDQEPDTIAIIPGHPNHVIIGTYSLVDGKDASANASNSRKGSLQILPFSSQTHSSHTQLDRKDFELGIYDIHFHPRYIDLLGIATSDSEILFFRTQSIYDEADGSLKSLTLNECGKVLVEEPHADDARRAIVTQFHFVDLETQQHDTTQTQGTTHTGSSTILLLATTQFGNTKLLKFDLPSSTTPKQQDPQAHLDAQILQVHKQSFDLEAWTVLPLFISQQRDIQTLLVLSGGDDSQLIISSIDLTLQTSSTAFDRDLDLDTLTPTKLLVDKRSHSAGVVSLCTLGAWPPPPIQRVTRADQHSTPNGVLVLTGSYDECMRVFLLTPPDAAGSRCKFELLQDFKMDGGVWRIILLDTCATSNDNANANDDGTGSVDFILLIAGHTAGAFIVKLSCRRSSRASDNENGAEQWDFGFSIEKSFMEHESLVYAADARRDLTRQDLWNVVSTSFYDKKVCNWSWDGAGTIG